MPEMQQRGVCVNYKGGCSRFEFSVPAREGDTCEECGDLLMHETGLTWADARAKEADQAISLASQGEPVTEWWLSSGLIEDGDSL